MKKPVIAIAAAILASAAGANAAPGAVVVIKASGERGWTLDCSFERFRGSPIRKAAGGGTRLGSVAVRGVRSGRCDYAASGNGALTLRFIDEGDSEKCPLARIEDHCLRTVAPEEKGSFDF